MLGIEFGWRLYLVGYLVGLENLLGYWVRLGWIDKELWLDLARLGMQFGVFENGLC